MFAQRHTVTEANAPSSVRWWNRNCWRKCREEPVSAYLDQQRI